MDVKIFSEGGMVGIYPMGNFEVNNSKGRIVAHGKGYTWFDFEHPDGKFSLFNDSYTKPNTEPELIDSPDTFILSDMFRILKQVKKVLSIHDSELGSPAAGEINELILRIDALFVPGDGIDIGDLED